MDSSSLWTHNLQAVELKYPFNPFPIPRSTPGAPCVCINRGHVVSTTSAFNNTPSVYTPTSSIDLRPFATVAHPPFVGGRQYIFNTVPFVSGTKFRTASAAPILFANPVLISLSICYPLLPMPRFLIHMPHACYAILHIIPTPHVFVHFSSLIHMPTSSEFHAQHLQFNSLKFLQYCFAIRCVIQDNSGAIRPQWTELF